MCLTLNEQFPTRAAARKCKPLIAKHNILVYKVLNVERFGEKIFLSSPYRGKGYILKRKYTSLLGRSCDCFHLSLTGTFWRVYINKGLHSYINEGSEQLCRSNGYSVRRQTFPAIIPKGSKYFLDNERGEIVSDTLIVYPDVESIPHKTFSTVKP